MLSPPHWQDNNEFVVLKWENVEDGLTFVMLSYWGQFGSFTLKPL